MQKQRFIWNFEIETSTKPWVFPESEPVEHGMHWEIRYFWPQEAIICLSGLDSSFLSPKAYEAKHKEDYYFILADSNYNLKFRRDEMLYKPLLKKEGSFLCYGKKINLTLSPPDAILPPEQQLTAAELQKRIHSEGKKIRVDKESLTYSFQSHPALKMELARISLWAVDKSTILPTSRGLSAGSSDVASVIEPADKPQELGSWMNCQQPLGQSIYYSLGLESKSQLLLQFLTERLRIDASPSDYLSFLRTIHHA